MRTVFAALVALMAILSVATAAPTEEFSFKNFLKEEWAAFKAEAVDMECPGCHFVLTEVKKELGSSKVESAIIAALDKVCDAIPDGIAPICEEIVDLAAPKVIAFIDEKIDADALCVTIKACPATAPIFVEDSLPCFLCTHAMTYVEEKVANNATESHVEAELEKLCESHIVPEKYQKTCDSLVEAYLPQLVNAFVNKMPPKQICTLVNLCAASEAEVAAKEAVKEIVTDSLPCFGCKYAFTKLEEALQANRTQAAIEAEVEKVCTHLGGFETACEAAVEAYFPKIVSMIEDKQPPAKICAEITLCNAKIVESFEEMALKQSFKCKACNYTINKVIADLGGNLSPANVESALDEVCDQLPDDIVFICESVVDMYDDEIAEFIEQKMNASAICKKIHFC